MERLRNGHSVWFSILASTLAFAALAPRTAIRAQSPAAKESRPRTDLYGDPLPRGALARLGTSRFRPGHNIGALAFAPDGRTLAGNVDTTFIALWDVASRKELRSFSREWWFQPRAAAFSRDCQLLAFCSSPRSFRLCDTATGKTLHDVSLKKDSGDEDILTLAFSPDGRILAVGAELGIRLWDVAASRDISKLGRKEDPHESIAFTPDGKTLAAGYTLLSDDPRHGQIQLWDVTTGQKLRSLPAPRAVWSIAISPDGKNLAAGTEGTSAHIWDLASGREIHKLGDREGRGRCVAFAPDGRTLAVAGFERDTGSLDGIVSLWDV